MKKKSTPLERDASIPLLQPSNQHTSRSSRKKTRLALTLSVAVLFGTSCLLLSRQLPQTSSSSLYSNNKNNFILQNDQVVSPGISWTSFQQGLGQCRDIKERALAFTNTTRVRHRNPRASTASVEKPLLIKNGHIWLGDRYLDGDVLIKDGLIKAVGTNLTSPTDDTTILDAEHRVVTPGIVDMHSHMGAASLPGLDATADENETTDPTTPFVRIVDAFNPSDSAIKVVASGGITTSLILPGSGNLMGGEAAVVKLRPVPTLSVYDMLISAGVSEEDQEVVHRYMKMACGENPKRVYGTEAKKMPLTRMGESYLFRKRFQQARDLLRSQNDWCDAAERLDKEQDSELRLSERFPEDIALESLVALLRGDVKLNVHCYLPHDLEAMVHHSLEYGFDIAAFHHALAAWQVPDIIKRAKTNITVATFADMWGYKHEGWSTNVHAPGILTEAGIPVAFKSDHPVMNARDLIHEAQKAYHYGFDEHKALSAVTSIPANALGVGHRIGSIQEGKDADLVIWERHPLRLGARPKKVIIDGEILNFRKPWAKDVEEVIDEHFLMDDSYDTHNTSIDDTILPERPTGSMHLEDHGLNNPIHMNDACSKGVHSFVLRNIGRLMMSPGQEYRRGDTSKDIFLVVQDDLVICAGYDCNREQVDWPTSSPVFDMNGAVVIPGIVSAGVPMGMIEIQAESSTMDGETNLNIDDENLVKSVARAADGIKMGGLHMKKAFQAGVTSTISQPLQAAVPLGGVSVAARIGVENTVLDTNDTLIRDEAALHFILENIGTLTVSQQIAGIRKLLTTNAKENPATNVFAKAAQGQLPVVVQANNKDDIAAIIRLKQQLHSVQFIILGGAEAHLVADHLQRWSIPVILMPARCYATTWAQRHCLPGHPYTKDTVLDVLLKHNVKVGLGSTDIDNGDARNLIWEAGWHYDLDFEQTVGLITWNLADMFGLDIGRIQLGHKADFVAYNGDPFEFGTSVLMVNGGGHDGPLCVHRKDIV
ncbi:uncharacterized protein BX664DRAFT_330873 [Halteromyces radiatus]|uniref:uncharacterized protein n=1 Tax=Halteromyces radiatus TaxID=101107 RepID=UPI00221F2C66|nr:uncharacterized protein BX664DRAFT_330873 [Halteromyces radiatus]KAI8093884.1 hypothetical protein BX664DRAFT_330873 [Halteromyces radiatus]